MYAISEHTCAPERATYNSCNVAGEKRAARTSFTSFGARGDVVPTEGGLKEGMSEGRRKNSLAVQQNVRKCTLQHIIL